MNDRPSTLVVRLASAALLLATTARAGLFWRDKVVAVWTDAPVKVDADDSTWDEKSAFEEDGFSVFARNDASDLYLLITGHTRESRDQLSGESRQDVALWFASPDGKTRRWGMRLPFSRRSPLSNSLRDPAGLDPESELVAYQGAAISTGDLPSDVVERMADAGRRPVWEVKIPRKRLEPSADGAVAMDFVVSAPPGGAKRRAKTAAQQPADGGDDAQSRGRGRGKRSDAGSHPEDYVWDALSYGLSVRLAIDPALLPR